MLKDDETKCIHIENKKYFPKRLPDKEENDDRNPDLEQYFMTKALDVAQKALDIGEVPIGCVIVLRRDLLLLHRGEEDNNNDNDNNDDNDNNNGITGEDKLNHQKSTSTSLQEIYNSSSQVIISHGANQVNATRDATRHAECIAIDRMITGGLLSDKMRLPRHVYLKKKTNGNDCGDNDNSTCCTTTADKTKTTTGDDYNQDEKKWVNVPTDENHWKNSYGWGSGKLYKRSIFQYCDLYVTCEPCIMVREVLRQRQRQQF